RSCRILRPTSSSWAGLFMRVSLTFMPLDNNVPPLCKRPVSEPRGLTKITADFHLLRELIKRDFVGRFTASALGVFWIILQPAILVGVYWFVFTYMIPMRG